MITGEPEDRVRVEERFVGRGGTPVWCLYVWYPYEGWNTVHSCHESEQRANERAAELRSALGGT